MSITFMIDGWESVVTTTPCTACDGSGKDCDYCIDGIVTETSSNLPEINLANSNAIAMIDLIGVNPDPVCGEWKKADLPIVRSKLIYLLNTKEKNKAVAPNIQHRPNFIEMGRSPAYVERTLRYLLEIVTEAQRLDSFVYWA